MSAVVASLPAPAVTAPHALIVTPGEGGPGGTAKLFFHPFFPLLHLMHLPHLYLHRPFGGFHRPFGGLHHHHGLGGFGGFGGLGGFGGPFGPFRALPPQQALNGSAPPINPAPLPPMPSSSSLSSWPSPSPSPPPGLTSPTVEVSYPQSVRARPRPPSPVVVPQAFSGPVTSVPRQPTSPPPPTPSPSTASGPLPLPLRPVLPLRAAPPPTPLHASAPIPVTRLSALPPTAASEPGVAAPAPFHAYITPDKKVVPAHRLSLSLLPGYAGYGGYAGYPPHPAALRTQAGGPVKLLPAGPRPAPAAPLAPEVSEAPIVDVYTAIGGGALDPLPQSSMPLPPCECVEDGSASMAAMTRVELDHSSLGSLTSETPAAPGSPGPLVPPPTVSPGPGPDDSDSSPELPQQRDKDDDEEGEQGVEKDTARSSPSDSRVLDPVQNPAPPAAAMPEVPSDAPEAEKTTEAIEDSTTELTTLATTSDTN